MKPNSYVRAIGQYNQPIMSMIDLVYPPADEIDEDYEATLNI